MKKVMCGMIGAAAVVLGIMSNTVFGQIATGGAYTLEQAVIANGGAASSDAANNYKIEGTAGQTAAGTFASGSYSLRSGFWAANPLAPTAAGVAIRGRVVGLVGEGLRNTNVTLSGGDLLVARRTQTNSFGFFAFEDITAGQTYIISVEHKRYGFAQATQVLPVLDNVADLIFQASWEN